MRIQSFLSLALLAGSAIAAPVGEDKGKNCPRVGNTRPVIDSFDQMAYSLNNLVVAVQGLANSANRGADVEQTAVNNYLSAQQQLKTSIINTKGITLAQGAFNFQQDLQIQSGLNKLERELLQAARVFSSVRKQLDDSTHTLSHWVRDSVRDLKGPIDDDMRVLADDCMTQGLANALVLPFIATVDTVMNRIIAEY